MVLVLVATPVTIPFTYPLVVDVVPTPAVVPLYAHVTPNPILKPNLFRSFVENPTVWSAISSMKHTLRSFAHVPGSLAAQVHALVISV